MSEERQDYFIVDQPAMLAIVGHCLSDVSFLRNCSKNLTRAHIEHPIIADIYDIINNHFKKHSTPPTVLETESYLYSKYPDINTYNKYRGMLHDAVLKKENFSKAVLSEKLSGWLKVVILKKTLMDGAQLYNSAKYDQAEKEIKKLITKLSDAKFEEDNRANLMNMNERLQKISSAKGKACTLGSPYFDEAVFEGAMNVDGEKIQNDLSTLTKGCLFPGEITMILGPSNSGKTTMLTTVAVSNIAIGKRVAIVSHEESEDKMVTKLFQSFTELTGEQMSFINSEAYQKAESSWRAAVQNKLFLYEWIKPGKMYCEDVIDMISNEHEKLVMETGAGFDLVIVDYPAKTRSREYGKGRDDWAEKEYIYEQYRLLARKYSFHCITPVQTNREGFKNNKEGLSMLDMDSAASGWGIMTLADIVISINRSYDDLTQCSVRFFIAKSRQGVNKKTFISETRYDLGRTHGLGYGCYVAEPADANKIDAIYVGSVLGGTGRPKTHAIIKAMSDKRMENQMGNIPLAKGSVSMGQVKDISKIVVGPDGKPVG